VIKAGLAIAGLSILSYAYIEPGTTSFLIKLAISALLGTVLAIRFMRNKISALFDRLFRDTQRQDGEKTDPTNEENPKTPLH
jgi:hypothetical protein